jgi:hypothetical protein
MGSDTSKISVNNAPTSIRLPVAFNLYYQKSWGLKFHLGEHESSPLYCAALPNSWYGDLVMYNGPNTDSPPLAKARNSGSLGNHTKFTLPPVAPGRPPLEEEMRASSSLTHEKHSFAIPTGREGYPQQFEWRHTSSDELKRLGESSRGWKLVWLNRDGHEEVVAMWADATFHRHMSMTKTARFMFVNRGATGEFGDIWALMAVVSFLRLWQKKMQLTITGGTAAGVNAGVVAGL